MKALIINIVVLALFEVLSSILLPEGKLKKMTLSVIGLYLLYALIVPIISFISSGVIFDF